MTAEEFRKMILSLPETSEAAHMGHPDFRVGGKIFASLGPAGEGWAMVKLTPEQQDAFARAEPEVFTPFNGAWGTGESCIVIAGIKFHCQPHSLAPIRLNEFAGALVRGYDER